MHNYTISDIKNLLLPNNFEVGDFVNYRMIYAGGTIVYQILRINDGDYTLRYISGAGYRDGYEKPTKPIKLRYLFMINHMTKNKNYEKNKN